MREQENERPLFAAIRYDVLRKLKLTPVEYMLLDMVYHLSAKQGYCYKTSSAMAYDLNMTDRGVRKVIERLVERELLARVEKGLVCGTAYVDCAYLERTESRNKVPQQPKTKRNKVPGAGTKFHQAEQSTSKNNNKKDIEIINLAKAKLGRQDEIGILYYQAIKALNLPVTNHDTIRKKIKEMTNEDETQNIINYLIFVRDYYKRWVTEFKPQINTALDIYSKRIQIKNQAEAQRQPKQPKGFKLV